MIRKITLLFCLCLGLYTVARCQTAADSINISVVAGLDSSCIGSPVTFTAHVDSTLTGVTYMWYVNDTATGTTSSTFTSAALNDSSSVYCYVYLPDSTSTDTVMSNTIVVRRFASVSPSVTIAVTEGNNPGCPDYPILFTATPIFGGAAPTYQWLVNGAPVPGATADTFSRISNNGDAINCKMSSSLPCASPVGATSAPVTITHITLPASIMITTTTPTRACENNPIPYYVHVVNSGSGATFQWYVNDKPVAGATDEVYTTDTLSGIVDIQCVMLAPDSCITNHTVLSNVIVDTLHPSSFPTVTANITGGSNPDCLDSALTFTATISNFGVDPIKFWYVNGIPTDTGLTYTSTAFSSGDVVTYFVTSTDNNCYSPDTFRSAPFVISVISPAAAPHISLIGNVLWGNTVGTYQWYGPNGMIAGATGQSYYPDTTGNYYAVITDSGCSSGSSNVLNVTALGISSYNISQVSIYPNPTSGNLMLDWHGQTVNMTADVYNAAGMGVMHERISNQSTETLDLSMMPNGNYFVVLTDTGGKMATVKVTVMK